MNTKSKAKSIKRTKVPRAKQSSATITDSEYVINEEGEMEVPFVYDENEKTFVRDKKLNDDTIESDEEDLNQNI